MRYAAVACVIAGGVLLSGSAAVALADPGAPGGSGGTDSGTSAGTGGQTADATTTATADTTDDSSVYTTATPGPVAVPGLQGTSRTTPLDLPNSKTPQRWSPITLPGLSQLIRSASPISSPEKDAAPVFSGNPSPATPPQPSALAGGPVLPTAAAGLDVAPAETPAPPTISLVPLFPKWIPTGPPVTIHNPLRDLLKLDLGEPFVPQLLPPPVVQILTAISQNVPLVQFMMDDFGLDPLLSDYIVKPLLSDIVVPTLPYGGTSSTPVASRPGELRAPAMWTLPASGPPPADIALAGMDMPQSPPPPSPSPLPDPGATNQAPQQHSAPPPPKGATPVSEAVAYRAGYSDYLRNAGMAQITSLALPGVAGILLVTAGGGFIGYRQARAGHVIRAEGIARFLR